MCELQKSKWMSCAQSIGYHISVYTKKLGCSHIISSRKYSHMHDESYECMPMCVCAHIKFSIKTFKLRYINLLMTKHGWMIFCNKSRHTK